MIVQNKSESNKTIKDLHLKIRFTNSPGPEVDAGQGTVDKLRPGSKTHRHVIAEDNIQLIRMLDEEEDQEEQHGGEDQVSLETQGQSSPAVFLYSC